MSTATGGAVDPSQAVGAVNKVVSSVGNGVANAGSKLVNGVAGRATRTVQKVAGRPHRRRQHGAPELVGFVGVVGSASPAPATSGGSEAVSGVTQPLKSGLQQAGGLVGSRLSRARLVPADRVCP